MRKCPCGKEITRKKGNYYVPTYCSNACRMKYQKPFMYSQKNLQKGQAYGIM